jgi:hypothetical protein
MLGILEFQRYLKDSLDSHHNTLEFKPVIWECIHMDKLKAMLARTGHTSSETDKIT